MSGAAVVLTALSVSSSLLHWCRMIPPPLTCLLPYRSTPHLVFPSLVSRSLCSPLLSLSLPFFLPPSVSFLSPSLFFSLSLSLYLCLPVAFAPVCKCTLQLAMSYEHLCIFWSLHTQEQL